MYKKHLIWNNKKKIDTEEGEEHYSTIFTRAKNFSVAFKSFKKKNKAVAAKWCWKKDKNEEIIQCNDHEKRESSGA